MWVKSHPLLTAGLAVVLILLYLVIRRGSSASTSAAASAGYQLQQYALETQRAQVQSQADVAGQQIAGALAAKSSDNATQLGIAQLAAGVQNAQTEAQRQIGLDYINYMQQRDASAIMAQYHAVDVAGAVQMAQIDVASKQVDVQKALGLASINAQQSVDLAGIAAQVTMNASNNATTQYVTHDNNVTAINIAALQAQVINNQTAAGLQLGLSNNATQVTLSNNQTSVDLASIAAYQNVNIYNATVAQNLGLSYLQTQEAIANINAASLMNISNQNYGINNNILDLIRNGQVNSPEVVQAIAAVKNQPMIGVASANQAASQSASSASMWSNLFGTIGNVLSFGLAG